MLVHLSDRTVGAVLSGLANFGTSDFGAPIHTHPNPLPLTYTRLHADSRSTAAMRFDSHTHMHCHTLSHTQNTSLGIPVGPEGMEEPDGRQWAGHLSCVATLRPLTMERRDRRVVLFFPLFFPGRLLHLTIVLLSPRRFFQHLTL